MITDDVPHHSEPAQKKKLLLKKSVMTHMPRQNMVNVMRRAVETLPFEVTMTWLPGQEVEMWRGDETMCAYREEYLLDRGRVVAHTHPSIVGVNPPPSGRDLVNCGDAVEGQVHWILTQMGVWRVQPTAALRAEVANMEPERRSLWETVVCHNTARLDAQSSTPSEFLKGLATLVPLRDKDRRVGFEGSFTPWENEPVECWPLVTDRDALETGLLTARTWPMHAVGCTFAVDQTALD